MLLIGEAAAAGKRRVRQDPLVSEASKCVCSLEARDFAHSTWVRLVCCLCAVLVNMWWQVSAQAMSEFEHLTKF